MKLLLCLECEDIVKLTINKKKCACGKSWGQYLDCKNAEYYGPCLPIGFDNTSFSVALKARKIWPSEVSGFNAFFIEADCPSIKNLPRNSECRG